MKEQSALVNVRDSLLDGLRLLLNFNHIQSTMVPQWDGYIVEWGVGGERFFISMRGACAVGDATMKIPIMARAHEKYRLCANFFFLLRSYLVHAQKCV